MPPVNTYYKPQQKNAIGRAILDALMARRRIVGECWEWDGPTQKSNPYGQLRIGRRLHQAHRVAYELMVGYIPTGKLVCHKCDNPRCFNPAHLFLGTDADNSRDASTKGRLKRPARHNGTPVLIGESIVVPVEGVGSLTSRETEVLRGVASGYENKEIASILQLSQKTVEKHRQSVYEKLGIKNTAMAVLVAVRSGLVGLSDRDTQEKAA